MPHYNGKVPLRMLCPHCGKVGSHTSLKTDPSNYYYDDEATEMFKRIAGRDISYRLRIKECAICGKNFSSVEMPNIYLHAMVNEIRRLQKLAALNDYLKSELDRLRNGLQHLADEAMELAAPRSTSPACEGDSPSETPLGVGSP